MAVNITNTDGSYVRSELHAHIYTIEWHHPQGNALTTSMLSDISHEILHASHSMDTHVVLLRSVGNAFCGGASFHELLQIQNEKEGLSFFAAIANLLLAMRRCTKFIVARVHGKSVGGGLGIIAAADYTIALEGADIKLSELTIGIGPFVIAPAVERKIGLSSFSQLAIDAANWRNADWARRKGLYAELHPTLESMDESLSKLLYSVSHYAPEAMYEVKKMFWHDTENWETIMMERAALSGKLITSAHAKNFLEKFRENKNSPV